MKLTAPTFRSIHDVDLFIRSGFTDARLRRYRAGGASGAAFDRLYAGAPGHDPWSAASSRSRYQQRKYDALLAMLPPRRFGRALDLGCGAGWLTERLGAHADEVVGADISTVALAGAARRIGERPGLSWREADAGDLRLPGEAPFDLIVVADTIYYLDAPIGDATIRRLAWRLSELLTPGGVLLLANHYFFVPNADTRLTRRIHDAFAWSPLLDRVAEQRQLFWLATLYERRGEP